MKREQNMKQWIKDHKKELIITGIVVTGTVVIVWKRDTIVNILKKTFSGIENIEPIQSTTEAVVKPLFPEGFLDTLTGNKMTASALGDKMLCSPQVINKRLISAGLVNKLPCGDYILTEKGKLVGEWTEKTTAWGYSFANLEWDEKVLELLFTSEEFQRLNDFKNTAQEILSRPVA